MYPRSWWVTFLIVGVVVNIAWPYLVSHSTDPLSDAAFRTVAWVAALGAVYLVTAWFTRSGVPRDIPKR